MTPQEALTEVEGLGYCLALRPGGLRLTGLGEPPPGLLALVREHRDALVALLEDEARRWKAHEESLAAGRVTVFPAYLADLVAPALARACAKDQRKRDTRGRDRSQPSENFR